MARIAGVDLPRTKRVEIGLTYIYGIGRKRSNDTPNCVDANCAASATRPSAARFVSPCAR